MLGTVNLYLSTFGLCGLFRALRAKWRGVEDVIEVKRADLRFPIWLRVPTTDVLVWREVFVREEYLPPVLRTPRVIVDAGANIGLTSVFFANRFPGARVVAIEPEEKNFCLLQKNVAPYEQIVPIRAALWSEATEVEVVDTQRGSWGFVTDACKVLAAEDRKREMRQTVRTVTVESIIADYDLHEIDLLKMDIEGAEREVFRDPSAWIGRVNVLVVELHERLWTGCARRFYNGSNGFEHEWQQGDNIWLARDKMFGSS